MAELSAGKKALADGLVVVIRDFVKRAIADHSAIEATRTAELTRRLDRLEQKASAQSKELAALKRQIGSAP